jgi:hypothetical protein
LLIPAAALPWASGTKVVVEILMNKCPKVLKRVHELDRREKE